MAKKFNFILKVEEKVKRKKRVLPPIILTTVKVKQIQNEKKLAKKGFEMHKMKKVFGQLFN